MSEKSILEQALLQINTLEEAVKQNAKGILASTMKEELKDLLKESLEEEDDDADTATEPKGEEEKDMSDDEAEDDTADDTEDDTDLDNDDETSSDFGSDDSEDSDETDMDDVDSDDVDTNNFGGDDTSDDETDFDSDTDTETEDDDEDVMDMTGASDDEVLKIFKAMKPEDGIVVKKDGNKVELETGDDEFIIKLDGDDDADEMDTDSEADTDMDEDWNESSFPAAEEGDEHDFMNEETIYEIEMEEEEDEEDSHDMEATESALPGLSKPKKVEPKENALPGLGKPKKVEPKESALPGLGKPKKVEPKESALPGLSKPKKVEPKESALPGLSKAKKVEPKESAHTFAFHKKGNGGTQFKAGSKGMNTEKGGSLNEEVANLRNQNAEYKKALVLFKEKLNEVAVFNANLAYATRIFTEHSTTKQEKLNILKRFDSVSTMNEAKGLYNTIVTELGSKTTVTESVAGKISNTPQSSSSQEMLSESKAYENPQFARIKEMMRKLK